MNPLRIDVAIVGGGIAGLWLANLLHHRGYRLLLLEAGDLGQAQTLASQGMIHGGLKYALGGSLTGASEAIADMPARWRACMEGRSVPDLSGLVPLSDRYYMFAARSTLGSLTSFFASRALRGRIEKLSRGHYPETLAGFDGSVYALNDFVLDTPALLSRLLEPVSGLTRRLEVNARSLTRLGEGWRIDSSAGAIECRRLILTTGAGTGAIIDGLQLPDVRMQLRPLHQVIVRAPALRPFFAHCLTGITRPEPRLTITSHPDRSARGGDWLWYLGGQIAGDGVDMDEDALRHHARAELKACLPWMAWEHADIDCLRVDRAEPAGRGRARPDEAFVGTTEDCLVCWPTKLSLTPDLGDRVLRELPAPSGGHGDTPELPAVRVGSAPWEG